MTPNYEKAATKAAETLVKYGISTAPIDPLPILKKMSGVFVISYESVSNSVGMDRRATMSLFGSDNQDAFTTVINDDDKLKYIVTYNQKLPYHLIQRALARELGHIVLKHDGSRPEDVRNAEAICFAHHLLSPRALLHAIQASGLRLTVEVLGNLTGSCDHCMACMRRIPQTNVPAELNRIIRDNFTDYIFNFFEYQHTAAKNDNSAVADIGTFMDGYEE